MTRKQCHKYAYVLALFVCFILLNIFHDNSKLLQKTESRIVTMGESHSPPTRGLYLPIYYNLWCVDVCVDVCVCMCQYKRSWEGLLCFHTLEKFVFAQFCVLLNDLYQSPPASQHKSILAREGRSNNAANDLLLKLSLSFFHPDKWHTFPPGCLCVRQKELRLIGVPN